MFQVSQRSFRVGVVLSLLAFAVSGCSGLSKKECLVADWEAIGYEDGAQGRTADYIGRHRKSCAKAEVTPDFASYEMGRERGVLQYCHPANGYREGSNGSEYKGVCPAELEDDFLLAYEDGRQLYLLKKAVRSIESDISRAHARLEDIEDDIKGVEKELVADETATDRRVELIQETKDLSREQGEIEAELEHLYYELGVRKERLYEYQESQAGY